MQIGNRQRIAIKLLDVLLYSGQFCLNNCDQFCKNQTQSHIFQIPVFLNIYDLYSQMYSLAKFQFHIYVNTFLSYSPIKYQQQKKLICIQSIGK